jgi:hypothetical protein
MGSFNDLLDFLGNNLFERTLSVVIVVITAYFAYRWIIEPVYTALRGMWNFWKLRNAKASFLEVTPPEHSEKQPVATQQLFAVLRQLTSSSETMSVEIVSSRREGIRYLIRALPGDIPTIKRHIVSYLPEAQFRVLEDFTLPDVETTDKPNRVFEIKQSSHYAYPLQPHDDLEASDPVAYIAGAMTKLELDETIIMQMVLARHHSYWTARIINQIMTRGYAILGLENKVRYFVVGR